jgi:hypothetical protein
VSIKVKVGGGRTIRAIPKEESTTPIVAPAERKPQIVPDSVVLGIDTIGPYIQRIDAGPGIIVFPEDDVELANVVISHANTSVEISTNNSILGLINNIDIDQFGHITQFNNTNLSPLNFSANGSLIQAKDITLGTTLLTLGKSSSSLEGLSFLRVEGDAEITGNITIGGNIILGDAPIDTINVVADFTSDIIPNESNQYNLGSVNKNWFNLYVSTLKSDTRVITIDETGALILPVGTTLERPTAETGMIRYNTSDSRFEGYDGDGWSELAGSVKDTDRDTYIQAESSPGADNDELDFFTAGVQRLQLDSDGSLKFGSDLDKVTIDYATGDTNIEGTLRVDNQLTAASLNVEDLVRFGVVTTGFDGELVSSANLAWDGTNLTILGGISVDGDFSTSGGLSGDSLSVGNLQANTIIYVSETGALQSNTLLAFDGTTLVVNAASFFNGGVEINSLKVLDLTQGSIVTVGASGELESNPDLSFDGTTFDINAQVSVASINVEDLTENRVVLAGVNGELQDNSKLSFVNNTLNIDGNVDVTGDISIGGNLTLGNETLDSINVVADFTSDLVPKVDDTYDLGESGSNWKTLYVRNITSDIDVVKVTANGAFTVPIGTTSDRPLNLESGMIRFNTSDGVFEGYSGTAWASLGGVKDVDQDTYIQAESSPGADNDELEFFTAGTRRFLISNTGVITTDANTDLVFNIGSGILNVGNTIITGVENPVNTFDAVNKNYLENIYARDITFENGSNTHILELLANNPKVILDSTLTVTSYDEENNEVTIGLDPVWETFTGLRDAGPEGFIPNFEFDIYGRVRSLVNVPLAVSSNAVVDFVPSIFGVIEDATRLGNIEEGITVVADAETQKLNFYVDNFDIDLTGAVTGSATVIRNSDTTINTEFDYDTLDARYLNVEGGDTANGDLGATKFVDKEDTDYYVWPSETSRIRNLIVGYGYNESSIQMSTGINSYQYIYATSTRIGYLSNNFNFGTYFDTTNNSWRVEDGSVFSRNFIDSKNINYLLNPSGTNSRFAGLNLDNSIVIGSNLTVTNSSITTTTGDLVLNPFSGIIDANTSIITNLVDPVNNLDAVNKQFLDNEISTISSQISNITESGISIAAELGDTDVVSLGQTITFAAGEGINTTVSNNQILIAGELANNTNIGVASFSINNFAVAGGEVTLIAIDGGSF